MKDVFKLGCNHTTFLIKQTELETNKTVLICVTGMPFNQLGTLAGSKFYNVEATYYYLRW